MQAGKASTIFDRPPYILGGASIAGKKEGEETNQKEML